MEISNGFIRTWYMVVGSRGCIDRVQVSLKSCKSVKNQPEAFFTPANHHHHRFIRIKNFVFELELEVKILIYLTLSIYIYICSDNFHIMQHRKTC